jgi:hypothetical protein
LVAVAPGEVFVIADFCRRLDTRGIVDRAVPVRDIALCTHGQVIESLIANRLTSPRPLVHVEQPHPDSRRAHESHEKDQPFCASTRRRW